MTKQLNTNQLERLADLSARAEVLLKVSTTACIGVGSAQTRPRRGCDFSSIFSSSRERRKSPKARRREASA
jgi:hypothetical protein